MYYVYFAKHIIGSYVLCVLVILVAMYYVYFIASYWWLCIMCTLQSILLGAMYSAYFLQSIL